MNDFKLLSILLILVHVIGDFYLQTENMSNKKDKELKWVIIHSLIYIIPFLFVFLIINAIPYWVIPLIFVTHFMIDVSKYYYIKSKKIELHIDRNMFIIDQVLHLSIILIVTYYVCLYYQNVTYNTFVTDIVKVIGIPMSIIITGITKILIIHKPANILIAKILNGYKPEKINAKNKDSNEQDKNAGRMIGSLERIIMLIFLSIQQYSAVGLVLTAKSIARYDKISKSQFFAEYYLLGTLLSTIIQL